MTRLISLVFLLGCLVSQLSVARIEVRDCVIQAPVEGASTTAAYFTVEYELDSETAALEIPDPEALGRVEIATLADHVELHKTETIDGVASMQVVAWIELPPPKSILELMPGGYHLMLHNLKQRPIPGETHNMRVIFRFDRDQHCLATVRSISELARKKNNIVDPSQLGWSAGR